MSQQWRPILERLGLRQPEGAHQRTESTSAGFESLPLYSAVADSESSASTPTLTNPASERGRDSLESCSRRGSPALGGLFQLPTLSRFCADFTLGFADGLTVPFALTAGLSSLGETDTVIYAGMAEICAGSISMGIGGYLAARGEVTAAAAAAAAESTAKRVEDRDSDAEAAAAVQDEKGFPASEDDVVARYLDPLDLPLELHELVAQHARGCPSVTEALLQLRDEEEGGDERLPSPLMAGSSVALGYLLGGMLPLFPYFLVSEVQDGMVWSFVTCAVALFVFGFGKDLALSRSRLAAAGREAPARVSWRDLRRSAWEGAQMVLLGSVAAAAAVLCVRAFEGFRVDHTEQT